MNENVKGRQPASLPLIATQYYNANVTGNHKMRKSFVLKLNIEDMPIFSLWTYIFLKLKVER